MNQHELLVDAICGATFSSDMMMDATSKGLAFFTGNQWNEDWTWLRSRLMELQDHQLERIYEQAITK